MSQVDYGNIPATSIPTPALGATSSFTDSDKNFKTKNDAGFISSDITGWSVAAQTPAATTRTYITGSKVTVPSNKLQIGTMFRWSFNITKTAAGTAASTYDIAIGTNGTTGDTARVSFTKPAGTAAVDEGWITITAIVRGPLTSACIISGEFVMMHNGNTAGHATVPVVVLNTVSAGFDATVANLFVGLCITSGASDAITIQQVMSEAWNL